MNQPQAAPRREVAPPPPRLSFAPIQDPELSPRACQVLWALCYWAWGDRAECWPSNAQVGRLIGCSPRTVQLRLGELEARGHVFRRMEKTPRGWHRVIVLAERHRPTLTLVEGGGAIGCATPPEGSAARCATPTPPIAPPLAQSVAPQRSLDPEAEEKELAAIVEGQGRPTTPPGPAEPGWLQVGDLNSADVANWREIRDRPGHPMRSIARKILERWERVHHARQPEAGAFELSGERTEEGKKPPASPAKNTPGASIEGTGPTASSPTKSEPASQCHVHPRQHDDR